jgi:hypothetical protein
MRLLLESDSWDVLFFHGFGLHQLKSTSTYIWDKIHARTIYMFEIHIKFWGPIHTYVFWRSLNVNLCDVKKSILLIVILLMLKFILL